MLFIGEYTVKFDTLVLGSIFLSLEKSILEFKVSRLLTYGYTCVCNMT